MTGKRQNSRRGPTAEQLIKWRGTRTQGEAADILYTPRDTYAAWERNRRSAPGSVRTAIELMDAVKDLERQIAERDKNSA